MLISLKIHNNKLFKLEVQAATEEVLQVDAENRVAVEGTVPASKYVVVNKKQVDREVIAAYIQYTLKARVLAQEVAAIATEEEASIKSEKRVTELKATDKELEAIEDVLAGVIYEVIEAADANKENVEFVDEIKTVTAVDDNTGGVLPEKEEEFTFSVVIDNISAMSDTACCAIEASQLSILDAVEALEDDLSKSYELNEKDKLSASLSAQDNIMEDGEVISTARYALVILKVLDEGGNE